MLKLARKVDVTSEAFRTTEKLAPKELCVPLVISFLVCIIAYITYRLAIVETLLADVTIKYRTKLRGHICETQKYKEENEKLRERLHMKSENQAQEEEDQGDDDDDPGGNFSKGCDDSSALPPIIEKDDGFLIIE
mgnify:CR=1 FL=1